ncbi:MAG TPA: GAF domain-containing protein, partial [Steroidobacteraceae bacterium]|nr:GAF domain-containing protein [Steroidobacteraceae bacterium]
ARGGSAAAKLAVALRERDEAIERQTATAEILKVISSSPTDLQPVLEAVAQRAAKLSGVKHSSVFLADGGVLRRVASSGVVSGSLEMPIRRTLVNGRAFIDRRAVHVADVVPLLDSEYPDARGNQRALGFRSLLAVPLLRDGKAIGTINCWRPEVRPFSKEEIALLQTFADQAVIAIENVRLFNETKEALERQTATADILKVISASPTATQPVFESIVKNCQTLFGDSRVALWQISDGRLFPRASTAYFPEPMPIDRESGVGACVLESHTIHLPDLRVGAETYPRIKQLGLKHGYLSGVYAPLLRDGQAIGAISLLRRRPGAFSDKEVALLGTFADQAVIAIENARLFNETREALERQTASAEVLRVISGTPADAQPVFEAIAQSAARVFNAPHAAVALVEGESLRRRATAGHVDARGAALVPFDRTSSAGCALLDKVIVDVTDTEAPDALSYARDSGRLVGFRAVASAPMLRGGHGIGVITVMRTQPGALSEKQRQLLQTFADQAVIAIENARLFNETKEALEQQTATAEILKVIASSPTDAQPVFKVIVESAVRLCGARFGRVYRYDGSMIHMVASQGLSTPALGQVQRVYPRPAAQDTTVGQSILDRRPRFIHDVQRDQTVPALSRQMIDALGTRSQVTMPMLRAGGPIGAIVMGWDAPDGFTDKQVALLQTFADQAVIAIENVRLFTETKEALERQTASAEILQVISSSPTDLHPVFQTIVSSCRRLLGGYSASVVTVAEGELRLAAYTPVSPEADEQLERYYPRPLDGNAAVSIVARERMPFFSPDIQNDPRVPEAAREVARKRGYGSNAIVPMLHKGQTLGALIVTRLQRGPFSEREIALLQIFANQAVIAMENVRLFNETKEALERQTATADILSVISRSLADVQPVLDALAERTAKLFGAANSSLWLAQGD